MAEGRLTTEWAQTATALALQANCNRDPKKRPTPFEPRDFMPEALGGRPSDPRDTSDTKGQGLKITAENIGILKEVFIDGPRRKGSPHADPDH